MTTTGANPSLVVQPSLVQEALGGAGEQAPTPPTDSRSPAVSDVPAQQARAHYQDPTYGFSFDYPGHWTHTVLAAGSPPGSILGLSAAPVPGGVGGVEFPYSSHIDFSLIVQDTTAPGGTKWGTTPEEILAHMAESQGLGEAVKEGKAIQEITKGGVEVWGLEYSPQYAPEYMWVVASEGRYNYLFFLTVGGAADDKGTVRQMFDEVIPSFWVAS